jgi:hypothetical protein
MSACDSGAEDPQNNPQPDQLTVNDGLTGCLFSNLKVNLPVWLKFQPGFPVPHCRLGESGCLDWANLN